MFPVLPGFGRPSHQAQRFLEPNQELHLVQLGANREEVSLPDAFSGIGIVPDQEPFRHPLQEAPQPAPQIRLRKEVRRFPPIKAAQDLSLVKGRASGQVIPSLDQLGQDPFDSPVGQISEQRRERGKPGARPGIEQLPETPVQQQALIPSVQDCEAGIEADPAAVFPEDPQAEAVQGGDGSVSQGLQRLFPGTLLLWGGS